MSRCVFPTRYRLRTLLGIVSLGAVGLGLWVREDYRFAPPEWTIDAYYSNGAAPPLMQRLESPPQSSNPNVVLALPYGRAVDVLIYAKMKVRVYDVWCNCVSRSEIGRGINFHWNGSKLVVPAQSHALSPKSHNIRSQWVVEPIDLTSCRQIHDLYYFEAGKTRPAGHHRVVLTVHVASK